MSGVRASGRRRCALNAVVVVLLMALVAPFAAGSQESPFGETSFISPKYGTQIAWTTDWQIDRNQSVIEQRRDLLGLVGRPSDAAVLIELQSQRSFRTAGQFISAALDRYASLANFERFDEALDAYPPSAGFEFGEAPNRYAGYVQAQAIEGAMMVAVVLALPGGIEAARELANDTITVNGVPLFEALPLCGDRGPATASPVASGSSGGNKPVDFDDSPPSSPGGDCVEIVVPTPSAAPSPTPTPAASSGRASDFNVETYESPSFPGVSLQYNHTAWTVDTEAAADGTGRDLLFLSHNDLPAVLYVETYAGHNGRAAVCIDLALREAGISPGSDPLLSDEAGEPIQGSQRGRVWGAYAFTLVVDESEVEAGGYVECRALPRAAGVLVVTLIARVEAFDAAYAELQPILQSIRLG